MKSPVQILDQERKALGITLREISCYTGRSVTSIVNVLKGRENSAPLLQLINELCMDRKKAQGQKELNL